MNEDEKLDEIEIVVTDEPQKKPDERGGIYLQGHLKIFDPETQEVLVETRGDN